MDVLVSVGVLGGSAAALTAFLVTRRDLGSRRAALAAAVSGAVVALGWFLALYLAFLAFAVAVGVYVVARRRTSVGTAVLGSAASYLVLSAASVALIWASLGSM